MNRPAVQSLCTIALGVSLLQACAPSGSLADQGETQSVSGNAGEWRSGPAERIEPEEGALPADATPWDTLPTVDPRIEITVRPARLQVEEQISVTGRLFDFIALEHGLFIDDELVLVVDNDDRSIEQEERTEVSPRHPLRVVAFHAEVKEVQFVLDAVESGTFLISLSAYGEVVHGDAGPFNWGNATSEEVVVTVVER